MIPRKLLNDRTGGTFYLHGQDHFRKRACADYLIERYVDANLRDFNLDRLSGGKVAVQDLASIIATPPVMAEWRVVHLKDAEALAGSVHARKVLLAAARKPPPGLVLVVEATVPKGSRAKFYRDMAAAAKSIQFKPLSLDETPGWLLRWAKREQVGKVEIDAAQALVGAVGGDLGVLTQEIRKLSDMVEPGAPIDREAVERSGLQLPEVDRWEWFDLVGRRRTREALEGLSILIEQRETPVGLVMGLATQLLRIGVAVEGGPRALTKALPPYQRFLARPDRIPAQARLWTSKDIANALRGLRRLDQLLKSPAASGVPKAPFLEEWLLAQHVAASPPPSRNGKAGTGPASAGAARATPSPPR